MSTNAIRSELDPTLRPRLESRLDHALGLATRTWCELQLWCLIHPNSLTRLCLSPCERVDAIASELEGAQPFLARRAALMGPNYASFGRLVVGEYDLVSEILAEVGDGAGDDELFGTCDSEFVVDNLLAPAWARVEGSKAAAHVDELVRELVALSASPSAAEARSVVQRFVIRYMVWVLLGRDAEDSVVELMRTLFFAPAWTEAGVGALRRLLQLEQLRLRAQAFVANSLAFARVERWPESHTRDEYAGPFLGLMGVVAFERPAELVTSVIARVPFDAPLDPEDPASLRAAIVEAARLEAPVDTLRAALERPHEIEVGGESMRFAAGTEIAAALGLAGLDPRAFADPLAYDLSRDALSVRPGFDALGFERTYGALRIDAERDLTLAMTCAVLVAWRQASIEPSRAAAL